MNQDGAVKVAHMTNSHALPTRIHSLFCPVSTRGQVMRLSLTCTFDQAVVAQTPKGWARIYPSADACGAASVYVYSQTIEGEVSVVSVAVTTKRPARSVLQLAVIRDATARPASRPLSEAIRRFLERYVK